MFGNRPGNDDCVPPDLQAPPPRDFNNPALETDLKATRRWLESLPLLNPTESVPALLRRLQGLNQEPLTPKHRQALLALYREPVARIFHAFDEPGLRRINTDLDQRHGVAAAIREIGVQMAIGCKRLALDRLESGATPWAALEYATEQLIQVALEAWRRYATPPPGVLRELHQIYRYARCRGHLTSRHRGPFGHSSTSPGIGPLYLQVMLLASLDPFHLEEDQCMLLYPALAPLATFALLDTGETTDPATGAGLFFLDPEADHGPIPTNVAGQHFQDRWSLDTRPIHRLLTRADVVDQPWAKGIGSALEPLAHLFGARRERQHPRHRRHQDVQVAFGIEAAEQWLRQRPAGNSHGIEVHTLGSSEQADSPLESWSVLNESIRGLLLGGGRQRPEIGELALVFSRPARAAVVRWLREEGNAQHLGIRLLPGDPAPATWRQADQHGPGILLPPVPALKLPTRLAVATEGPTPGQAIDLDGQRYPTGSTLLETSRVRLISLQGAS